MSNSKDAVIDAAHHHSDLNIFGAIIAILEGGTLYTRSGQNRAERVIKICKDEIQRQVRGYDNALRVAGVE